jgi:hypothetical protein
MHGSYLKVFCIIQHINMNMRAFHFKVPISLVGPLMIWKERKKLVNKFKIFFWFSTIISKIQASKLQFLSSRLLRSKHGYWIWPFSKLSLSIRAWDSGTVGSLEACIFEIIVLNQKLNLINVLTGQTRILFSVSMERSGLRFSNTYSENGPHSNVI